MAFIFHVIYGMSSFPLTNSYFSRWLKPPTRYIYIYIYRYRFIYRYIDLDNINRVSPSKRFKNLRLQHQLRQQIDRRQARQLDVFRDVFQRDSQGSPTKNQEHMGVRDYMVILWNWFINMFLVFLCNYYKHSPKKYIIWYIILEYMDVYGILMVLSRNVIYEWNQWDIICIWH